MNKKTFPLWVKLFLVGVIALVIFSLFWNWRFFSAYTDVKNSTNASAAGNLPKAEYFMTKAADEVPEAKEIAMLAAFYKGVNLLKNDKSTAALAEFDKCRDLPEDFHVNQLVLEAEMGSGYDTKNYKLFLTSAKAFLQLDTTKSQSWAGVASAYACLYAQYSADSLKQQSLKYFNRAKIMDDTSADAKEFYGQILYRLDTKQIISKDEFDKKFPGGYKLNTIR